MFQTSVNSLSLMHRWKLIKQSSFGHSIRYTPLTLFIATCDPQNGHGFSFLIFMGFLLVIPIHNTNPILTARANNVFVIITLVTVFNILFFIAKNTFTLRAGRCPYLALFNYLYHALGFPPRYIAIKPCSKHIAIIISTIATKARSRKNTLSNVSNNPISKIIKKNLNLSFIFRFPPPCYRLITLSFAMMSAVLIRNWISSLMYSVSGYFFPKSFIAFVNACHWSSQSIVSSTC